MYQNRNKPTALSHYLRTGRRVQGFEPNGYKTHDLCDMCGGAVFDLDVKGIISDRNSRYRQLLRQLKAAKADGKTHKIWQIRGGITTRPSHKRANGQKVGIDEHFRVGDAQMFLPSDPDAPLNETANCRCVVRYVKDYKTVKFIGDKKLNLVGMDAVNYVNRELRNAEDKRGPFIRQNKQLGVAVNRNGTWNDAHPFILEDGKDTGAGIRGDKRPIDKNTRLIVIGLPRKDSLDLIFRKPYSKQIFDLVKNNHVPVVVFKVGPDNRQFIFRPPAGSDPVLWKPLN